MKPILFSAELASKISSGTKTQTRRLIRLPDSFGCLTGDCPHDHQTECADSMRSQCPLGDPGDRLWVRENWQCPEYQYAETYLIPNYAHVVYQADYIEMNDGVKRRWRPSIHMPRWASRLTLLIKDIRVEVLKSITEADAISEGFDSRQQFLSKWRQIYGAKESLFSKDSNGDSPWVWVIEFEVVQ